MLSPEPKIIVLPQPPKGVRMSGLQSDPTNGPGSEVLHVLINITKDFVVNIVANWAYDRIVQYRPKGILINGRDADSREEFERIMAEELEIGKND